MATEKAELRVYDDTVRMSFFYRQNLPELQNATIEFLSTWSGRPVTDFDQDPDWNLLKYIDGHFAWHKDKVRFKSTFQHLGTQIVFPPLSYSPFENGELNIFEDSNMLKTYRPVEDSWFYIIIPLGYAHCVERVKGTRYSFTK